MAKRQKQAIPAFLFFVGILVLAALACNSDQDWLIPLTETPTSTPTIEVFVGTSTYNLGDSVSMIGGFQVWLTNNPEPDNGRNRLISPCFQASTAEILDITEVDGVVYYSVDCGSGVGPGWVTEENLQPAGG